MGCGGSSCWAKIAFVATLVALLMDIIGFATASWMVYQIETASVRVGLWRMKACLGTTCNEEDVTDGFKTEQFVTNQIMQVIAFIFFVGAPFIVGLYCFVSGIRNRCMCIVGMVTCFTAAGFALIGVLIFVIYVPDPYITSYSMGLVILGALCGIIAGLLLIPDLVNDDFYDDY